MEELERKMEDAYRAKLEYIKASARHEMVLSVVVLVGLCAVSLIGLCWVVL